MTHPDIWGFMTFKKAGHKGANYIGWQIFFPRSCAQQIQGSKLALNIAALSVTNKINRHLSFLVHKSVSTAPEAATLIFLKLESVSGKEQWMMGVKSMEDTTVCKRTWHGHEPETKIK